MANTEAVEKFISWVSGFDLYATVLDMQHALETDDDSVYGIDTDDDGDRVARLYLCPCETFDYTDDDTLTEAEEEINSYLMNSIVSNAGSCWITAYEGDYFLEVR